MTLAIVILLAIQPPTGRCLNLNQPGVVLVGTIKPHTFPGPPNWESVARGDEPERYWLLHLEKPIWVEADDFEKSVLFQMPNLPATGLEAMRSSLPTGYSIYVFEEK